MFLIWMLISDTNNNWMKNVHKRCHQVTYCSKTSSYEQLFKNAWISYHLPLSLMKINKQYQLRCLRKFKGHLQIQQVIFFWETRKSVQSMSWECFLNTYIKVWDIIPTEIKNGSSLDSFQESIKMEIFRVSLRTPQFYQFSLSFYFVNLF